MGYLVNRTNGLTGAHGIGYDYILAGNGIYVQAESPNLVARISVAAAVLRGLAEAPDKVELTHGLIPGSLFEMGLRWLQTAPDVERFFAISWNGSEYRLEVPEQDGTAASLRYTPPRGAVMECHSHARLSAFFSGTDDRDEQAFRIYGVVGKVGCVSPELVLRVGVYGHFAAVAWSQVFTAACPVVRLL